MEPINESRGPHENLFNYTSGRWLWNEAAHLSARYQRFDVEQLKIVAAKAVGASSCIDIIKLPEGANNRCFELTMDNDTRIIARLPGPQLAPSVVTNSEVATMDFLRTAHDVPVPKVFAWSDDKTQNVGVEYILMEKAQGQELYKVWSGMTVAEKIDLTSHLVSIQAKISQARFESYGSLCYSEQDSYPPDLEDGGRFTVGPSVADRFWEGERKIMDVNRGPWTTPSSYLEDTAVCEKAWIKAYAKPRDISDPLRQSDEQEDPARHLETLDRYIRIATSIVPTNPQLNLPTIAHPDLHAGNIFVKDGKISSIIDWQGSCILPSFLNTRMPKLLRIDGPLLFELPEVEGMTVQEKQDVLARYQATQLQKLYARKLHELSPAAFLALSDPHATTRQQLVDFSGSTWDDDEGLYFLREMIYRTCRDWEKITGRPQQSCPIEFSDAEAMQHKEEGKASNELGDFFKSLGIPSDGWVHNDDFERKSEVLHRLADTILDSADDKEEARQALRAWRLTASGPESKPGDVLTF